jgi:hypothetical protein
VWSTISATLSNELSTITVVTAMTAARFAMPRSRTAVTTARAQEAR